MTSSPNCTRRGNKRCLGTWMIRVVNGVVFRVKGEMISAWRDKLDELQIRAELFEVVGVGTFLFCRRNERMW